MKYENDDPKTGYFYVKPIIDYIQKLGKDIAVKQISYYSKEDELDALIGIEGLSIDESKKIEINEVKDGQKFSILLKIKDSENQALNMNK